MSNVLILFFQYLRIFTFPGDNIPNYLIQEGLVDTSSLTYEPYNPNTYLLAEFQYGSFLLNVNGKIFVWLVLIVFVAALAMVEFLMKECTKWRSRLLIKVVEFFFYSGLIMFF